MAEGETAGGPQTLTWARTAAPRLQAGGGQHQGGGKAQAVRSQGEVLGEGLECLCVLNLPAQSGSERLMQFCGLGMLTVSQAQFLGLLTLGRVICCHLREN